MEQQPSAPGIAGIATKYGLIQGVLAFIVVLVTTLAGIKQGWVDSVAELALLVVFMVLAHQQFKKTHAGMMTYAQGLGSGTLLSLAAAVVRCVLVYVYVTYINTGYLAVLLQAQRAALEQRGYTGAQLEQAMSFLNAMFTPVGFVVTSLISGVFFGFIVALIVSIFTRKGDPTAVF